MVMSIDGLWTLLLVVAIWYVMMRWLLPWMGISTCMTGACRTDGSAAGCARPSGEDAEEGPR